MRKFVFTTLALCAMALVWYLFIKRFEFEVNFKSYTLPGDIIETLRIWDRSLADIETLEVDSLNSVTQKIIWNKRTYLCQWNLKKIGDSTTQISADISQPDRRIKNKILVPFTNQQIEQDAKEIALKFRDILQEHLKITRVEVVGEAETLPFFCLCRSVTTDQPNKAKGMMENYNLLTGFIADFHLQVNGPPIVKISNWKHNTGEVKFDFCFPIAETDSLPRYEGLFYKELKSVKSLKAIYHGNYVTSDRAWYALADYAETNGFELDGGPVEYFYNNPSLGAHEDQWRADIYMPIK